MQILKKEKKQRLEQRQEEIGVSHNSMLKLHYFPIRLTFPATTRRHGREQSGEFASVIGAISTKSARQESGRPEIGGRGGGDPIISYIPTLSS